MQLRSPARQPTVCSDLSWTSLTPRWGGGDITLRVIAEWRAGGEFVAVSNSGPILRGGATHDRWQHKPTMTGSARIWLYVDGRTVLREQVHSGHPNETK